MLVTLHKIGEVYFRFLGTNGFHVKAENEQFTAAGSRCRQNLKYENFTSSSGRLRLKNCNEKRVARAAQLFFLIQPIESLICGVVVVIAVAVVVLNSLMGSLRNDDGNWNYNVTNQKHDWLNEEKIIVLQVRYAFWCNL